MTGPEGWGWPVTSDRWHYFRDGASLCELVMNFNGDLYEAPEKGAEVCKVCQRALKGRKREVS